MSNAPLHLLHLQPDTRRLAAWASQHRLLDAGGDLGYALHGLLNAAFGSNAPRAFRYLDAEQGVLAYTSLAPDALLQMAALAPPDVAAALGLGATLGHSGLNVRPFPAQWPTGHVLGFEVRARPVVREGKTGRERDAFLASIERNGDAPADREASYAEWLGEHLDRQGGAELVDMRLAQFSLLDVTRLSQKTAPDSARRRRSINGPDALLTGHLRVTETDAFSALLARGIGRHRAFGFGMLLLRPAAR